MTELSYCWFCDRVQFRRDQETLAAAHPRGRSVERPLVGNDVLPATDKRKPSHSHPILNRVDRMRLAPDGISMHDSIASEPIARSREVRNYHVGFHLVNGVALKKP